MNGQQIKSSDQSLVMRIGGTPSAQKTKAVKGEMNSSESTAIHPNYGLNSLTNLQLAKQGKYSYTPWSVKERFL